VSTEGKYGLSSLLRTQTARCRLLPLLVLVAGALAPSADAYTFGPTVRQTGPEETVFDWTTQRCEGLNIPDFPVRAYRDAADRVHLTIPHTVNHQLVGPTLGSVNLNCGVTLPSHKNADPAAYDDAEWVASPYTLDGNTVYALVHEEFQGRQHAGQCSTSFPTCFLHSITFAKSTDGGATYTHASPPDHLVAAPPDQYVPDVPSYGYSPSNIVRAKDNYFYAMLQAEPYGAQQVGECVMRTRRLSDPTSWRAWDGSGYTISFIDPYLSAEPAEQHVCTPVAYDEIEKMNSSLSYSTFFGEYLLVGATGHFDPNLGQDVYGFYYSTSPDLIHWSPRELLMEAELPWTYQCGDEHPLLYPSVIDPNSQTRNFETTGRSMYLYFTRMNYNEYCTQTLDRDLVRIPFEFPIEGSSSGYARPKGATPMRLSLVQAYRPCTAPDSEHGEPLVVGSCSAPTSQSGNLTVGTGDANGFMTNSVGSIRVDSRKDDPATPGDETDVKLFANATDVRRAYDFAAYTGELLASFDVMLTDLRNGWSAGEPGTEPATTVDIPFSFALGCRDLGSLRRVGATCSAATSANAVVPGTVSGGARSIWQVGEVELYDGGEDGVADTPDNDLFEVQGVFTP
jgi:hypothetical protein